MEGAIFKRCSTFWICCQKRLSQYSDILKVRVNATLVCTASKLMEDSNNKLNLDGNLLLPDLTFMSISK